MEYYKVVIYTEKTHTKDSRSYVELEINSKEVLHETEIFTMMEIHFPAYCKFLTRDNQNRDELELTAKAYAYSIFRNRKFNY